MGKKLKKEIEKLNNMSLHELGDMINTFGKKYKNEKIKSIYEKDPGYIEWLKNTKTDYYIGNEFFLNIEISRQAMITYYDLMNYLKNQGR